MYNRSVALLNASVQTRPYTVPVCRARNELRSLMPRISPQIKGANLHPVPGWSHRYLSGAGWEDEQRGSYRVQDFVEVHEADGHRDGLQEDGCEHAEPQTGQRHRHGHATAWPRHPDELRAAGKHFQRGGQVRSSSAAYQLRRGRKGGSRWSGEVRRCHFYSMGTRRWPDAANFMTPPECVERNRRGAANKVHVDCPRVTMEKPMRAKREDSPGVLESLISSFCSLLHPVRTLHHNIVHFDPCSGAICAHLLASFP